VVWLKKGLILIVLLLIPLVVSLEDNDVEFEVNRGFVTIKVSSSDSYSNIIEFIVNGETQRADFSNCAGGICDGPRSKIVSFSDVNIYQPGSYTFTITPLESEDRITKSFDLDLGDLFSCEYNGEYVKDGQCYSAVTNDNNDKPLKCVLGVETPLCGGAFGCGCPGATLCCTNENIAECEGKLGECYVPSSGRVVEAGIKESGVVVSTEVVAGCVVDGIDVADGICLNNVLGLELGPRSDRFAQQCGCVDRSLEADGDNDGFDSEDYVGGVDCRDDDPNIHPLVVESCSLDTGYDGIDNNCDEKKDLDCNSYCDKDEDGYTSHGICVILGKKTGECDDEDAHRYPNFPGEEICWDQKDNDCDGDVDENSVCVCRGGETRNFGGVRGDGIETCNSDGKGWTVTRNSNESPFIQISSNSGLLENQGNVGSLLSGYDTDDVFGVRVKFICPGGNCDVEIE
tara:strand:+ start:1350 stop:2720 length:1371 start_codon:yes stop_codon:yes gene_type:complete